MKKIFSVILFSIFVATGWAQRQAFVKKPTVTSDNNSVSGNAGSSEVLNQSNGPRKDSLAFEHRNDAKDSITLTYKFIDGIKVNSIDSSVDDFDKYYSVPSTYQYLGNNGAAAFPLLYQAPVNAGWDLGFHAFDVYKYSVESTKYYTTTKPFSSLSYQLASGKEQMLKAGHTQNPSTRLNVGFDYKLISAPGLFVTQSNNHNGYRFFGHYQGAKKRAATYWSVVGNNIRASENGGIVNDSLLLDPNRKDRFSVPVNLGGSAAYKTNPFATTVTTGNTYRDFNFFIRQSYDFGKKDSVAINDSTTEYLFYPKLRLQYSLQTSVNRIAFGDVLADSSLYHQWYGLELSKKTDTFQVQEKWNTVLQDFSLVQFPDTKNQAQFFLAGISLQNIHGSLASDTVSFYNLSLHGAYQNQTRNKKWDLSLNGSFYLKGFSGGDYQVHAGLSRKVSNRFGYLGVFFHNVNRTPSFVFDNRSSFNFVNYNQWKKENITSFGIQLEGPLVKLGLTNNLIFNQVFFKNYYQSEQYSTAINLIQLRAETRIPLFRKWAWYTEGVLQQVDQSAPIRVPLLFTRNRLAFEGRVFKNLQLSTGVEVRYYTPYKANAYSPVLGQFVQQDTITIKNKPDIALFAHFRIKGFAGFLRAENLNTAYFNNGFSFVDNNFAAPHYPTPGLMIRFGIQWWFVN
jgi:hypothetical protein